ncbi:zinc finger protein 280C [Sorex fumeus]|uniref:zinc finger protein 280C n=1 Tax=Sorex fumeus TaxID=62283 RepID=UPI0024ACD5C8|nr:zinc finger protein 280C [Sorex fumeus]
MDDSSPLQPKSNFRMAELFMECEEEELEPWQRKVEEMQEQQLEEEEEEEVEEEDDDDELIFVGEILSSKPAISNILNRGNPSSSSNGIKNEILSQGGTDLMRSASQHSKSPASRPATPLSIFNLDSESKSSQSSISNVSKPDFASDSLEIDSDESQELFDLTQDSESLSQDNIADDIEDPDNASFHFTTGIPVRACPKCSTHFTHFETLQFHMKHCCPDMIHTILESANIDLTDTENTNKTSSEKGKLIMLVSDFYYGRHEGAVDDEPKTFTTFKCFSCSKVLKNNIRFMNHMKHHLELEKQNSESWENHTTCQHCYRQFPTPFQLQCHIESTHTPHEFSTICKICELSFETEHTLLQHMKDTHKPGEMPYVCQVCQFRSSTFSDVEAHFRASHENTKNLLCPFCLKVSRMATPYMNHYMKHQKKGVHRCAKCRLQFLTCKEKLEHKNQHRTFIKPKELEGLPSGTKVTIRASFGSVHSRPSTTSPPSSPSTSSFQLPAPKSKSATAKSSAKCAASKSKAGKAKVNKANASKAKASKAKASRAKVLKAKVIKAKAVKAKAVRVKVGKAKAGKAKDIKTKSGKAKVTKYKINPDCPSTSASAAGKASASNAVQSDIQQKIRTAIRRRYRRRKTAITVAMKNVRCNRGLHKCIECHSKIKDFAGHFSIYIQCNFCKYNTNCNKAFVNHMVSSHSNPPSKRFYIFRKHPGAFRAMTLVCLKCDFLAHSSCLDLMAKHLSQRKNHTCQVIEERVRRGIFHF